MSNRALWNVRRRHESLRTTVKRSHLKLRKRRRIGLEQALERRLRPVPPAEATEGSSSAE